LAQRYGKTPAQVMLRHLLQKGFILIPKSTNEKRLRENIDVSFLWIFGSLALS
jgi:diketogulonate reductase-like aldo/keto reductase